MQEGLSQNVLMIEGKAVKSKYEIKSLFKTSLNVTASFTFCRTDLLNADLITASFLCAINWCLVHWTPAQ